MEQIKGRHQLRMAVLNKRLEAHQKAFSLLRGLRLAMMIGNEVDIVEKNCEDWWWENNLYLDSESRELFFMAVRRARSDYINLDSQRQDRIDIFFEKALESIERSVELPPISDKFIKKETNNA